MAGGGDDRLSELPDDLLRRILHFAPLKEAASTTALSRRWRAPLWLSSGAVNLVMGESQGYRNDRFFIRRGDLVSAAAAALDAAEVTVTRLTLRRVESRLKNLVDVVLSQPTARRVEELRIDTKDPWEYYYDRVGLYTVTLDSLPLETLRVLELSGCKELLHRKEAAALALAQLSSLRLCHGTQHLSSLQRIIDAAPELAVVRLEYVLIDATDNDDTSPPSSQPTRHLRCPAATMLVLDSCRWEEEDRRPQPYSYYSKKTIDVHSVEIHAPRLRRFRYKGPLRSFSFSPHPLELEQVDLDFYHNWENKDPDRDLETFWRFARSFSSTKEMRLTVNRLDDIAILSEARRLELLPAFRRLRRLEVQGANLTKGKTPAMTILNLLRCCPVLSALRINVTCSVAAENKNDASNRKEVAGTRIPSKEIQIAALLGPRHFYQCLHSSLKRVGLKFQLEKSDCFGVKLVKFFAENAMVLEEMRIDGRGDENLCKHMNPKTEKWNSKRKRIGATSFVILPLKR